MSATHSKAPGANSAPLGRFLRISDVIQETSLSRATIYRLIAAGTFPSPIRVGVQRVAWSDGAVQSWKIQQASIANR